MNPPPLSSKSQQEQIKLATFNALPHCHCSMKQPVWMGCCNNPQCLQHQLAELLGSCKLLCKATCCPYMYSYITRSWLAVAYQVIQQFWGCRLLAHNLWYQSSSISDLYVTILHGIWIVLHPNNSLHPYHQLVDRSEEVQAEDNFTWMQFLYRSILFSLFTSQCIQ